MRNVFVMICLILESNAEIYLSKSSDITKGCDRSNGELMTYDDIFGDTVIENAIRNRLENNKSGSAWISGYPRYSPDLSYHGCYNMSCKLTFLDSFKKKTLNLSDARTLFKCAEDCSTSTYRHTDNGFIGISHERYFCVFPAQISSFKDCAVNNSFCADTRDKLHRRAEKPVLFAPESGIITVFSFKGTNSITDDDRKKLFVPQCTYVLLNNSTEGFRNMNSSCDLGQGSICSNGTYSSLKRCRTLEWRNTDYCVLKLNESSFIEAEKHCHQYSGILSKFTPPVAREYMEPNIRYLLGTFREFVISNEVDSTDMVDCVYVYIGKSDRAIKIGAQACSTPRHSLCKVQISAPDGQKHSEATVAGVSIGILTCLIVLVIAIVIWKKRRTTEHHGDATTQALKPEQGDVVNCAQDEDSKTVNNEYASVIYSCSDNEHENEYSSTIQPQKQINEACLSASYKSAHGPLSTEHVYQTTSMINNTYDKIDLKGKTNHSTSVRADNVYAHTADVQQHYDTCSDLKINNTGDSNLYG